VLQENAKAVFDAEVASEDMMAKRTKEMTSVYTMPNPKSNNTASRKNT
jgi:hypothetical protein